MVFPHKDIDFRADRPIGPSWEVLGAPYTAEDDFAVALGKLNDDQFNEVEQRIGLDPSSPGDGNRVGRLLDAVNAHQYNFFVTVERISAYDIKPKVEAVDAAGDKPNVGVIIIG